MKHFFLSTLISLGLLGSAAAQNEARNWFFGEFAGLHFPDSSITPVALTTGQLSTREGCTSISDSITGNLLFYTDGQTVWNSQHQVMTNGTGLMGNPSSTQAALIVPNPGSPGMYYIFTSDIPSSGNGIHFSEVNVTTNSVDSVSKNTPLLPGNTVSERLAATRHANGTDYWVMTHDLTDGFFAFQVSAAGVDPVAVVSNTGTQHTNQFGGIGYLKFSPSGTKAAVAISSAQLRVEAFNFNNATGQVSAPIAVIDSISAAYGVEFSPNERYLYVTGLQRSGSAFSGLGQVAQYDLQAGSLTAINQSRYVLASTALESYGALQLAPNGQIMVAKETPSFGSVPSLDVIENPNSGGINCNFNPNSVLLDIAGAPHRTRIGLPNFVSTVFKPLQVTGVENLVVDNGLEVSVINPASGKIDWQFRGVPTGKAVDIVLTDLTGRQLLSRSVAAHPTGSLALPALARGVYVVAFTIAGKTVRQRIVME
jgi:hypothetical protein